MSFISAIARLSKFRQCRIQLLAFNSSPGIMDAELNSTLDQIASKEDVKGVLLADEMGLCLGARGIAKSEAAANAAAIARTARDLLPAGVEGQYPTITLDYEHSKVVIRNEGSFTLAIFT